MLIHDYFHTLVSSTFFPTGDVVWDQTFCCAYLKLFFASIGVLDLGLFNFRTNIKGFEYRQGHKDACR